MKKILLTILITTLSLPYLFLLSDVKEVPYSNKRYNCTISKVQQEERKIGFGSVYYSLSFFSNKRIIMPYFLIKGDMTYADCEGKEFAIGFLDFDGYGVGTKIHVITSESVISIFGINVRKEESIEMFSTGWPSN